MTRKSKRGVERTLDELGAGEAPTAVAEWVQSQLRGEVEFCYDYDDSTPAVGEVLIAIDGEFEMYVDRDSVPEWIDVENDLPVE